jgi:hypothetical protein
MSRLVAWRTTPLLHKISLLQSKRSKDKFLMVKPRKDHNRAVHKGREWVNPRKKLVMPALT